MRFSIDQIISNDEKARQMVEQVTEYRRKSELELKRRQEAMKKQMELEVALRTAEASAEQRRKMKQSLRRRRKAVAETTAEMDRLYEHQKDAWAQKIFRQVVSN